MVLNEKPTKEFLCLRCKEQRAYIKKITKSRLSKERKNELLDSALQVK